MFLRTGKVMKMYRNGVGGGGMGDGWGSQGIVVGVCGGGGLILSVPE